MSKKVSHKTNLVDLSKYDVVFCDSVQALEWAYQNGLPESAIIKSSSPAMLWNQDPNVQNIESRWTIEELEKFRSTIPKLTIDIFNASLSVTEIDREIALTISQSVHRFQNIIYKAACLDESDFIDSRLFIYVDGETGPSGNMMNSPWDELLSQNPLFSTVSYTLKNDNWEVLTTKGVSYWRRFKVAGYETIIYRLAIKLMNIFPKRVFKKEVIMPNENELNIEIASSLALRGVRISRYQSDSLSNSEDEDIKLGINITELYKEILPIVRKRVEEWVTPSSVEVTMSIFKSYIEQQLKQFKLLVFKWEKIITKNDKTKNIVLINAPANIKGYAISYVCRKNSVPVISSQHGVTLEISKEHNNTMPITFDNSVADIMFSYNSKIVHCEEKSYFNKSKHYIVGMPLRHTRMKSSIINNKAPPIVYISSNLYHMGLSLSKKTDYGRAIDESNIVSLVLSMLPHKIRYKTYPDDNRRYSDIDPVLNIVNKADNIELFNKKIDMRYLVFEHRILVTTCATSTLSWPVMSNKPVIFINQQQNSPLTDEAYISFSKSMFVFNDNEENFHKNLREFLSQPLSKIEALWQKKKGAREDMIRDYFSAHSSGAGVRSAKIIIQEYL